MVTGSFYFKKTSNGNLLGEFLNTTLDRASTESCDWIDDPDHPLKEPTISQFPGTYSSSWQEKGRAFFAILEIIQVNPKKPVFQLEWSKDGNAIFKGRAMLCDSMLVGDYHSV